MITKILASRWLPWLLSLVLVVFGLLSQRQVNWEKVSRQNAEAALDTTRSISTKQGEVYARLLAQKDVELAGALASAAHQRGSKPVAQVGVVAKEEEWIQQLPTYYLELMKQIRESGDRVYDP
jgi:hypothetical protein